MGAIWQEYPLHKQGSQTRGCNPLLSVLSLSPPLTLLHNLDFLPAKAVEVVNMWSVSRSVWVIWDWRSRAFCFFPLKYCIHSDSSLRVRVKKYFSEPQPKRPYLLSSTLVTGEPPG